MFYKPEIRKAVLAKRKHMDPTAIAQASLQAAAQLLYLPQLIESRHIGYYISHDGELDPSPIVHVKQMENKYFYLPVIDPNNHKIMSFYLYHKNDPLIENRYGIKEPSTDGKQPFKVHDLDIVFVPLVSFDKYCYRIGRGAGYYDKTFAFRKTEAHRKKPMLIGLAYEFQKINQIEPAEWDVPMDLVITEKAIYKHY